MIQRESEGVWCEEDTLLSWWFPRCSPSPTPPTSSFRFVTEPETETTGFLSPFGLFLIWKQKSETLRDAAAAAAL